MWNNLSMKEKAAMMKVAVSNGITDLDEIRKSYNSFAEGGPVETDNTPWKKPLLKIASDIDNEYLGGEGMAAYNKKVQQEKNRRITDEEVVNSYIKNTLYIMENPNHKGFRNGKYYPYADSSSPKNIGPGINYTSDMGKNLDFSGKTGYTREFLDSLVRDDLILKMRDIRSDLHDMYGEDSDTLGMGKKQTLLDLSHNVRPRGKKRANMPKKWPSLVKGMMLGDFELMDENTYSGSTRRQLLRNDMTRQNIIDENSLKNR